MRRFLRLSYQVLTVILVTALPATSWALSLNEKVRLQAAMQRHIDQQLIDGQYLYLNPKSGEIEVLYPVTTHPKIMQMGKIYILCFDFKNSAGANVNVDFYIAPRKDSLVVFQATIDDRAVLKRLMKAGKIRRAD